LTIMAEPHGLLDHFRAPLYPMRKWEGLHAVWATSIMASLNELLPREYFAEASVHVGSRVEVDVGTFEWTGRRVDSQAESEPNGGGTALAVERATWVAPPPQGILDAVYPDSVEVLVYADEGGAILAAAVELVSPGNKDRPEFRKAFVAKCASYLQQGVGVVIVDIVTVRHANLHDELAEFLGGNDDLRMGKGLYTSAYRPVRRKDTEHHDVWMAELFLGSPLPTMPLALRRGPTLPLDLDAPYREACRRARIG
jgi:Protein of unknown function (DUF4058)